jgi:hypothetical protein
MTEFAVRHGMASVTVKDYARKRMQQIEREFGVTVARPVTPLRDIINDQPELAARGAFVASPSPDGPLAIGYVQ